MSDRVPHYIVFLNGPPQCGKDAAASFVMRHYGARHYKMASPLKKTLATMFNLTPKRTNELFESPLKEEPCDLFSGMTPRQALIHLSEKYMKPTYGDDIFGVLAVRYLPLPCGSRLTVISDSGFEAEAVPVIQRFGRYNCALIHIHRDGHTFEGDSRSYIELDKYKVATFDLYNKFEYDMYEVQVVKAVRDLTNLAPTSNIFE